MGAGTRIQHGQALLRRGFQELHAGLNQMETETVRGLGMLSRATSALSAGGGRIHAPRAASAANIAGTRNRNGARPRQQTKEINRWDSGASSSRRVPNFVQNMTGGLATKKEIQSRYGNVVFQKGKPAPKPLAAAAR